jgi:hypothetical protein
MSTSATGPAAPLSIKRADGLEVLGDAVAGYGWFGILRETDSERRPIPGALSVSVRGRTMP